MLTKEAIEELREIYMREFGRDISFEHAHKLATELLRFYKTVLESKEKDASENC